MTVLAPYLKQRWVDGNGAALYQGTISTYAAGTLTPIATYKDSTGTVNTNPIVLNARGECDLWLNANVSYKFIVADALGNQIPGGTIDNVINSQLLTLYGGVDTGSTNAYILNFNASFSAYADGIVIIWIPANTNTGASTINVNGLGVVNIVNPDGSALLPGQIIANQPAQLLFKGGAFELITPAVTTYGSFTATWSGFSVPPASTFIPYRKTGPIVTLTFPTTTGTSNATSFVMTGLPAILKPSSFAGVMVPCLGMIDNSVTIASASVALINGATGQINFFKDPTQPVWTAAGSKGFANNPQVTYST